jgi:hypothetical protein
MEAVKELIHMSEIFDYKEDKIRDESDPLFDGSLKQQEVALVDSQEEFSPISTQVYKSESLKALFREVCYECKDICRPWTLPRDIISSQWIPHHHE